MKPKSEVMPFDWTTCCDIIGELQGKQIYAVTDQILLYLDWSSFKNAGVVSKRWRTAILVALGRIARKAPPNWPAKELSSWRRIESHLKSDFKVSVQDPRYAQCLTNCISLIIDQLQGGRWPSPAMTLDYLPYLRNDSEDYRVEHLCRMEMSDNFIIAWESSTRLFKCWSRRTLSPISMDEEFHMRNFPSISRHDVEKEFHLLGNHLYYAESPITSTPREKFAKVDLTKVDLVAKYQGINEAEEFKASILVEPSKSNSKMLLDYVNVVDDMVLLAFGVYIDGKRVEGSLTIQRKLERGETRKVLKRDTLQFLCRGVIFFDKDYLIVQWSLETFHDPFGFTSGFSTYSLHPRKDGSRSTVELCWISSFELTTSVEIDYKEGLLAYTTMDGDIALIDVSSGTLRRILSTSIEFLSDGSKMRLIRDYVVCSESDEQSDVNKGTTFHVWDLHSIIYQPHDRVKSAPLCKFSTLTSSVEAFAVDDLGIAAVIEKDSAMGIQVLSFLPACSHCKRLTQPALLTKCNACKSAAYCSEDCRTADWNPHHQLICAKVNPLSFVYV